MTAVMSKYYTCHISEIPQVCYSQNMKTRPPAEFPGSPIEPGLLQIFRAFCGAIATIFFLFLLYPPDVLTGASTSREVWAILGFGYSTIFFFLSLPQFQKLTGHFFLPIAIAASILLPIGTLSWQPYLQKNLAIFQNPMNIWSLTLILLFPLVLMAWQYEFKIVVLFFGLLGVIDPIVQLLISGSWKQPVWQNIYTSLTRLVAFIAIGFVISQLKKNLKQRQNELHAANKKLQAQAERLEELAISRERNRLSQELHDILAHTLSSLAVQLEAIDATISEDELQTHQRIEEALKNTRNGLTETRRAMQNLRAKPLVDFGFQQALQKLLNEAAQRGGFSTTIDYDTAFPDIPPELEQSLYRITQEALENTLRHAEATKVHVSLHYEQESGSILISLRDNGTGFHLPPEEKSQPATQPSQQEHYGLGIMQERAKALQGTLTITSFPGTGTTVQCSIPYSAFPAKKGVTHV